MCKPNDGESHVCKCGTCTCKPKEVTPPKDNSEKEKSKKS